MTAVTVVRRMTEYAENVIFFHVLIFLECNIFGFTNSIGFVTNIFLYGVFSGNSFVL